VSAALKAAAAAILLLACVSCSRAFAVKAVFIDGRLAFIAGESAPRGPLWCLEDFAVGSQQGDIAWAIDDVPFGGDEKCSAGFPLRYGQVPPGAKETVPARPLRPRELYIITGYGGDPYEGAFVLFREGRRLSVENLDPNSPAALAARDRIDRRRSRPPVAGGGG
jgi:hypothetical protein